MKQLLIILSFAYSLNALSASVTIPKFEVEFHLDNKVYDLDVELQMLCRYERLSLGNSAKFSYKYETVSLDVVHDGSSVVILNPHETSLSINGPFKSNKGCQSKLSLFIEDKRYAIGWAGQITRPVRLGFLDQSPVSSESVFDTQKLRELLAYKEMGIHYLAVGGQVNAILTLDDQPVSRTSSYSASSIAKDPETELPYLLN